MSEDKDIETVLALLPKENVTYYTCCADIPRAIAPEKLSQILSSKGLQNKNCGTVKEGYAKARESYKEGELIFIGGSCFVVGEALTIKN